MSYDPDFNTKSLRGNAVVRWEYVRGSTLFVVWDRSQADYTRPDLFRPLSDISSAFGADATHTLMVKVTYWINRRSRARSDAISVLASPHPLGESLLTPLSAPHSRHQRHHPGTS